MIKRLLTLLIAIMIAKFSVAQELLLKCDNLQPRIGQTINISLQADFMDDILKSSIPFDYKSPRILIAGNSKTFNKQIIVTDTGSYSIGPIEMEYNGQVIKSNEMTIKILPALPDTTGIWLRLAINGDKKYIILEQNILLKMDSKEKNDKVMYQMDKLNNTPLAEIDISSIESVSLKRLNSTSSSKMDTKSQPFTSIVKTSVIIYEIEDVIEKTLTITKKNMLNLIDKKEFKKVSFTMY